MNYLIILNSDYEDHLIEISKLVQNYDSCITINKMAWLIQTKYSSKVIREHLMHVMSVKDALFVFRIGEDYATSNALDVLNWLEDSLVISEK